MISAVTLKNFKAFKEATLSLKPLTMLSGVNAVGKSTLLQALAVLRQTAESDMFRPEGGLLLNGDYVELGAGEDVLHDDYTMDDAGRPFVGVSVSQGAHIASWAALVPDSAARSSDILDWSILSEPPSGMALFGQHFQYLRADRIMPAVTYPKSYDAAVRKHFLGVQGEHTVNFLRVHRDSVTVPEPLRHPKAEGSDLLRQTEAWMQDLCPGVNLDAVGIPGTDLVQLSYGFYRGISQSQIRYRPTNVGFGITYVLPIVVACLSAQPGALLLLENPEAHLHPRAQSAMAQLIARTVSTGAQVVVETHSDHVLNGIRIAVKHSLITGDQVQIHYVDRPPAAAGQHVPGVRVQSPTVHDDGTLSSWPEGFFDQWEVALDQLLD